MIRRFWNDKRAATSIEYAMVAGFISILIVTGATSIGRLLSAKYIGPIATGLS